MYGHVKNCTNKGLPILMGVLIHSNNNGLPILMGVLKNCKNRPNGLPIFMGMLKLATIMGCQY